MVNRHRLSPSPARKRGRTLNRANLAERIESERRKLFRAMGVVGIVGQALQDAKSTSNDADRQNVLSNGWCALETTYEIMKEVAGPMVVR